MHICKFGKTVSGSLIRSNMLTKLYIVMCAYTGVAEIVKHFKMLYASPLRYHCVQVYKLKQWPLKLVEMECWGFKRTCMCCGTFYSDGVHYSVSAQILLWTESTGALSPNAIHWWGRQGCEEGSATCIKPPAWQSSVCTPENIARVLASVGCSLRCSACKLAQALGMSDRSVGASCLVTWTFTNTDWKLCILEWSGQRGKIAILSSISWMLTENPELPNNH